MDTLGVLAYCAFSGRKGLLMSQNDMPAVQNPKRDIFSSVVIGMNAVGCFLTMLLMCITVTDVAGRFFFNRPLVGATELIVASIVIIAFLQIPLVQLRDAHLKSTVLYDHMPKKMKNAVVFLSLALGIIVFSLMLYSGWDFLLKSIARGDYEGEGGLRVPTWPGRLTIVISSAAMILIQARQLRRLLQGRDIVPDAVQSSVDGSLETDGREGES